MFEIICIGIFCFAIAYGLGWFSFYFLTDFEAFAVPAGLILGTGFAIWAIVMFVQDRKKKEEEEKASSSYYPMSTDEIVRRTNELVNMDTSGSHKPASVTKRAIAGTIIGGVPGAIIGAASAIDKNAKSEKK